MGFIAITSYGYKELLLGWHLLPLPRFMHRHSAILKELGIKTTGDMLVTLKLTKEPPVSQASHLKPLTAKLPQLNLEITPLQFRRFRIDWDVFTKMTHLLTTQTNIQLYSICWWSCPELHHQNLPWVFQH